MNQIYFKKTFRLDLFIATRWFIPFQVDVFIVLKCRTADSALDENSPKKKSAFTDISENLFRI